MNKKLRIALIVFFSVGLALMIGCLLFWLLPVKDSRETDAYLAYEKLTDAPYFSFDMKDSDQPYHAFSDFDWDIYNTFDEISPEKMLIVTEVRDGIVYAASEESFLLYNPETVEDPLALLTPYKAVLRVSKEVNGKTEESMRVVFDDPAQLASVWSALLNAEAVAKTEDVRLPVSANLQLFLDKKEQVSVNFLICQKADGSMWLRVIQNTGEERYEIPCEGAILETLEKYLTFVNE